MRAVVTAIQRFSVQDGPGIRTTVFLKGCPLRCKWCHNPETQSAAQEILYYESRCILCGACAAVCPAGAHGFSKEGHTFSREFCRRCGCCGEVCPTRALEKAGKEMDVLEIVRQAEQDAAFYGSAGGITLSGGEPMAQPEAALRLLSLCKARGIHTTIETCGWFDAEYLPALVECTDLFLWDYKLSDPVLQRSYTGVSLEKAAANLLAADRLGAKSILRCILVRGVNTNRGHYSGVAEMFRRLRYCMRVEWLPCHAYGDAKARALGRPDTVLPEWIPTPAELSEAKEFLSARGVPVR